MDAHRVYMSWPGSSLEYRFNLLLDLELPRVTPDGKAFAVV